MGRQTDNLAPLTTAWSVVRATVVLICSERFSTTQKHLENVAPRSY